MWAAIAGPLRLLKVKLHVIVLLLGFNTKLPAPVAVRLVGGGTSCELLRWAVKVVGSGFDVSETMTNACSLVPNSAPKVVVTGCPPPEGVTRTLVRVTALPCRLQEAPDK